MSNTLKARTSVKYDATADLGKLILGIEEQDQIIRDVTIGARARRIATLRELHSAFTSKTSNASKMERWTAETIEAGTPIPRDFNVKSNQEWGYMAVAGELVSLPGELPESVEPGKLWVLIKNAGGNVKARKIIRRKGQTVESAHADLVAEVSKSAEEKSDEHYLKAALSTVLKACEKVQTDEGKLKADEIVRTLLARYSK